MTEKTIFYGTLWLDYRFYEEIGLYVFIYNGGMGAHTYYAPAASVEEYQEALERLETFREQHMEGGENETI